MAPGPIYSCREVRLPPHLEEAAARTAVEANPSNAPALREGNSLVAMGVLTPGHLALLTTRRWPADGAHLSVAFLDNPNQATRRKILQYANNWGGFCNASFRESADLSGADVRVLRDPNDGYYSYLGTDSRHVRGHTMNLAAFTEQTPDSEYARVVQHEFGHALAFEHEHSRPEIVARLNPQAVIAEFERTQGWSEEMIVQQILTPADEPIDASAPDDRSIMCYSFGPELTVDGRPIPGGTDFTALDRQQAAKCYPLAVTPPPPPQPPPAGKATRITLELDGAVTAARVLSVGGA